MRTYCKAEMKFIDVTALEDASVSSNDNQSFGNVEIFQGEMAQADYGTLEQNQFVLDGSKEIMPDAPEDVAFWSGAMSKDDCTFESNPKLTIDFTAPHTSAGLTMYFAGEYPAELKITWYDTNSVKIISESYYPDVLCYVCNKQVQNYGKVEIEFVRTMLPERYIKLQYILYGKYIVWDADTIKSAKLQEDIDTTSITLPINEADISIVDANNDFDAENEGGSWKSVQKTQEVVLSEYYNGEMILLGAFFVDGFSFSKNVAKFSLVDGIGLLDKYTFYDGEVYVNVKAETILQAIFAAAGVTKYAIEEDVGNTLLSGYLAVQSCRDALQKACFACGAVADDSRSDTIHIYKPDRYVTATVGTNRKFNGGTIVSLEDYVSGVSLECTRYSLEDEESDIYDETLPAGDSRLTFSDPYLSTSITATVGTIKEVKTNYLVIHMDSVGQTKISGKRYASTTFSYQKNVAVIDAGETENIKKISGSTLLNADLLPDIAEELLKYYALRKKVKMKYLLESEHAGNWVNINSITGKISTTLIESQSIDLSKGYIATATCRGYSVVVTDCYYTGTELYAGGGGII